MTDSVVLKSISIKTGIDLSRSINTAKLCATPGSARHAQRATKRLFHRVADMKLLEPWRSAATPT